MNESISEEEERILLEKQHKWYNLYVLFEIVKESKNRTIDFLSSKKATKKFGVRYYYAGMVDYLKSHLESVGMLSGSKLINMYRSIAHFKSNSIPVFTYNLSERKSDPKYIEFDKDYLNHVDGFDLVFDIDSPKKDVLDAYRVAKEVKAILDEYKVPYYLKNSGTRGFHLIIPYNFMPNMKPAEILEIHQKVLYNISGIYDLKDYIDLSVAGHPKTLIKSAYSFDSGNISVPMNDFDFDNFTPEKVTFEYMSKNITLGRRGLLIRDFGLKEEELKSNTTKFLNDFK